MRRKFRENRFISTAHIPFSWIPQAIFQDQASMDEVDYETFMKRQYKKLEEKGSPYPWIKSDGFKVRLHSAGVKPLLDPDRIRKKYNWSERRNKKLQVTESFMQWKQHCFFWNILEKKDMTGFKGYLPE